MPVFVSYSFQDEAIFSTLDLALDSTEIERWDSGSMSIGESLGDQLKAAIGHCEVCIFIATRRSIESPWCLAELGAFWGTGKRVILFMADPDLAETSLPPQFKGVLRTNTAPALIEAAKEALNDSKGENAEITEYEFFKSCGEYGTEKQWSRLLDQSCANFTALGVTLSAWRRMHQFEKMAHIRAKESCKIRLLLMHPENPLLEGILYSGRDINSVKTLINESVEYFQQFQEGRENIEVRLLKSAIPHFSFVRSDNQIILTQYVYSETWGGGPTWKCFKGTSLFDVAMNDFGKYWDDSVKVT